MFLPFGIFLSLIILYIFVLYKFRYSQTKKQKSFDNLIKFRFFISSFFENKNVKIDCNVISFFSKLSEFVSIKQLKLFEIKIDHNLIHNM